MTARRSSAGAPGAEVATLSHDAASKPRPRARALQASAAGLLPPAPPLRPVAAAGPAQDGGWCVWSCDRGAYLAQDGRTYGGARGEWGIAEAKAIAAARPVGERAGAIPVIDHG